VPKAACRSRDSNLFPSFIEFAKSDGKGSQEESALLKELKKVSSFLEKSEGPYFGGASVNALDLQIAPKLKHIFIGAKALHVSICSSCTLCAVLPFGIWLLFG